MGDHGCVCSAARWIEVGNILDSDCIPCPECTDADRFNRPQWAVDVFHPSAWWFAGRVPPVDSNDTAPGLETEPDRFVAGVACWDQDRDHPSPGDDITCEAFDAVDGAS